MRRKKPSPRVSLEAARELLWVNSLVTGAHETYSKKLRGRCLAVHSFFTMDKPYAGYVALCGMKPNHRGDHEDVGGGLYW